MHPKEMRSDDTPARSEENDALSSNRRRFLKLTGASAIPLGGFALGPSSAGALQDGSGGPPNPDDWSLAFEDQFEGDSLDTSKFEVGWGWGTTTSTTSTEIVEENVTVQDSQLRLKGTHDGDKVLSGGVNTRNTATFGPGTFFEAKLKFAQREGFHPAFWAKPTEYSWWPPEIDVVELLQNASGRDDTHTARSFLHYTQSTKPGDDSTAQRLKHFHEPGDDLTKNFHVYGCEWQNDGITIYVDGTEVKTFTNSSMLESMRQGAPFYINLTQNINVDTGLNEYLGTADTSQSWGEETVADWVRVWEQ